MEEDPPCTAVAPPQDPDLDLSFTSIASSFSTTTSASSARSSLSLPFDPRFSFSTTAVPTTSSSLLPPRPHNSSDPRWSALRAAATLSPDGSLHLHHLKLLRQLGSGHLARVFHCRLADHPSSPDFALKVVDVDALARAKNAGVRLSHVRTEARVLADLDHPFLPTLYAQLEAPPRYSCFLLDYCPGGDLHALLHHQPGGRLPLEAARFVSAEVLLALEYLHAAGFIYRDLKPENVLRRADGHVVLSDFDLCLPSEVVPTLHLGSQATDKNGGRRQQRHRRGSCCFGARGSGRDGAGAETLLEFVAEPEAASSTECVGTHEYLAPEVASGECHGAAVDWWAFGIFLYELLYGRTPFKGSSKESTLRNIRTRPLHFPASGAGADSAGYAAARDLITRLLVRDPRERLGSARGAAELKRHPFFEGVDWPLIRCYEPPSLGTGAGGARKRTASIRERRRRRDGPGWLWKLWRSAAKRCKDDKRHNDINYNHNIDNINAISGTKTVINAAARSTKRRSSMNGWFD
ncbi:hypothetical protein Taro_028568 [Colocasia esculenta]|uniref:non-specific serine/threonine protein kinase n=1 Tax=Colocasia esculenta TaxID=4460 RepID=A0A843VUJ8_COLES|nr:hypothetical protein [Colocasia esculenta]